MQQDTKTNPIGIETQIDNVLFGQSQEEKIKVNEKINFFLENIDNIKSINGNDIYYPIIKGDYIYYCLTICPEYLIKSFLSQDKRNYYYPIQYANIELLKN